MADQLRPRKSLPRELETPSGDKRSAPRAARRHERTLPPAALGDEVGGERRAASARVVRDDEHGVLAQDVADVGSEALRGSDERRAATAIELRSVDVNSEAGLAFTEEDTRGGCDGVAGEILVGGSRDRGGGLLRVDRPAHRRTGERLALAEANDDSNRARRDGLTKPTKRAVTTTEAHVQIVTRERAAFKKWAAPDYVIIWFDGPTRVRLTVERLAGEAGRTLRAAGWKALSGGRHRRTVSLAALPEVLAQIGELLAEKGSGR